MFYEKPISPDHGRYENMGDFIEVFINEENPQEQVEKEIASPEVSEQPTEEDPNVREEQTDENGDESDQPHQRPQREKRPPKWTDDFDMAMITVDEALSGQDKLEWSEAIKNEIKSHLKNQTWVITEKSPEKPVVSSKLVLTNKYNSNGELERRKARLVARGFTQRPGIDFHETFAPVVRLSSLRFLLGLAVEENLKLHQLDVNTAFLNGDLEEEIYMEKPVHLEAFLQQIMLEENESKDKKMFSLAKKMLEDLRKTPGQKVCRLQKSLYGLKQAGRQWFKKLDNKLIELGFSPIKAEPCMYINGSGGDKVIVAVYVDDFILASSSLNRIEEIKRKLTNTFDMKDMGSLHYCLGMKFDITKEGITISQKKYTEDILRKFGMQDCKAVTTPLQTGMKLTKGNDYEETLDVPYQSLIGSLMYLAVATRPDISYAVSYLSQFNSCYQKEHWQAAKRVLRYISQTRNLGLSYTRTERGVVGMADADWASSHDRKSYTGYCFTFGGAVVSWESKKQKTVALSTAEAEYMSLTEAAKEAMHLKMIAEELGLNAETMTIYTDNQAAKCMAENPIVSSRSKHISIKENFIRDIVGRGIIKLVYKPSEKMEADLLTKALPSPRFIELRGKLGLKELCS